MLLEYCSRLDAHLFKVITTQFANLTSLDISHTVARVEWSNDPVVADLVY